MGQLLRLPSLLGRSYLLVRLTQLLLDRVDSALSEGRNSRVEGRARKQGQIYLRTQDWLLQNDHMLHLSQH